MSRRNFHWLKSLAPVLAVLSAAIVFGFWLARSHYEDRLARQIWPLAAPEISVVSNPLTNSIPTVLLLGDSRMAQWDLPLLVHWRVVNAGADGLTTGQLRLCAPKLLDKFHPDAVVLEAAINDLKFLGLRPDMASQIISLAASNLTTVVHECASRRCKVIVLETWPAAQPDLARRLVWNAAIPASVISLNAQIRLLDAPEREIRVVDLFGEAGLKPEAGLYRDTLHFKPAVYQCLTPALEKELEAARHGVSTTK
jgi:lysophospholipase L1-like esterase